MKELYLNAEMDVVEFDALDVIATSGDVNPDGGDEVVTTTEEWVPSCNQGKPDYNAWG